MSTVDANNRITDSVLLKLKSLQFEYGFANGDSKYLMKDFYKFFDYYGYVIGPLKPNGVIFSEFKYELNNFNK